MEVWLMISERSEGSVQCSLSNAEPEIGFEELARKQEQMYFMERTFQHGKSHLGPGDYEARRWRSWRHHTARVGLAMFFTLLEREALKEAVPLLTARDLVELMRGRFSLGLARADLINRIAERHQRRFQQVR